MELVAHKAMPVFLHWRKNAGVTKSQRDGLLLCQPICIRTGSGIVCRSVLSELSHAIVAVGLMYRW